MRFVINLIPYLVASSAFAAVVGAFTTTSSLQVQVGRRNIPRGFAKVPVLGSFPSSSRGKIARSNSFTLMSSSAASLDESSSIKMKSKTNDISFPVLIWKFSRPHTLIGSAVAIPALHCLAAPHLSSILSLQMFKSIIVSVIPSLLINIYITGLNQITDVDIDLVNKPYLPIPAGQLTVPDAKKIVSVCLTVGLSLGLLLGSPGLNMALWGSAILGTIYSLPPFRLKRFPLLAATCIVAVRGTLINVGFFAHAQKFVFGNSSGILKLFLSDRKCLLSSLFYCIFGIVIALMKDVPDVEGDAKANIRSFSVRVGQKKIFKGARRTLSLLLFGYGAGFLNAGRLAVTFSLMACRMIIGLSSIYFGVRVRENSRDVNPESSSEVYDYYMYLWKIFYLSYFSLPFAR